MANKNIRKLIIAVLALIVLMSFPTTAYAHSGGEGASPIAGTLAWSFLVFGVLVIAGVSVVLFSRTGRAGVSASAEQFESLKGFSGYIGKMRLFSRNARLFIVHVVGMDVIYGTWAVIFNLYLLAVGFDIVFIGLRILLGSIASGLSAIPAGLISDRIGRKLSFILGDGVGAVMSLIAISTSNEYLILGTAVVGGVFGALHGVAEPSFMAENSENYERVHLFSVSSGTRTAAAIIGSALAGLVPLIFITGDLSETVNIYRSVAYAGIAGWFASLIPALMLRQGSEPKITEARPQQKKGWLANVRNPDRIWRITAPQALVGLGAGFALPLLNIYFRGNLGSEDVEIGAVFAVGQGFLVVATFLAPLIVVRLGKVRSVIATRLISIPFILLFAFVGEVGAVVGSVLAVAGFAYVSRITFMNMASPVRSAFSMEILDPKERGTQVGIENALTAGLSGTAAYFGAQMMDSGDFRTPFLLMALFYLLSTVLFSRFFSGKEQDMILQPSGD